MKPRLLVLSSTFPRWKDDTDPPFVYELSRRLTGTFEVFVHAPHYPGAKVDEIMDGMVVHRFRYFFSPLERLAGSGGMLPTLRHNRIYYCLIPFFLLSQLFSLCWMVYKKRPDVVHAHWLFPQGWWAVVLKKVFRVPVLVTAHGADVFGLKGRIFRKIKGFVLQNADGITAVSKALGDVLVSFGACKEKIEIIPMGIDRTLFNPGNLDPAVRKKFGIEDVFLLYVGRLTEKKGVKYLIDAMPEVMKRYPRVKLLVVGDGEQKEELENMVARLGLTEKVIFAGAVPNNHLPAIYATADIFIGPSIEAKGGDREGFGLTFVEAAMSGCFVIGTDTGGIGDIIEDGVTGFLVPEKDSRALAEKIIYALDNRENTKKIRESGRRVCRKSFDWQIIAGKYKKIIGDLLSGSPGIFGAK